jgi:copper transport protein
MTTVLLARPRRVPSALLAMLLAALLLVLLTPARGSAHAYLERSNPADGATLAQGPEYLRLGFSEHVVLPATTVTLTDSAGRVHPVAGLRLVTDDVADTEEPSTIVADLPDLPRDTYRVAWQTLSSDDLHRTSGTLVFGVRTSVRPAPFHETPPLPGEAAATGLLLLGLALGLGGPLARRALARVPGPTGTALRLLLLRVARGGVVLALVASVAPLALDLAGSGDARWTASGSYVVRWGVREAGLVLLLAALLGRRGIVGRTPSRSAFLAGACLVAAGTAALGHAATGDQPVRVIATALHLTAALTWAGSVACLGIALLRAHRALPRPSVLAALRRFARPAAACLAVTAVTGVFLASDTIGSVDAALRTTYGRSFLLKLLLVVLASVLALVNHRRLRRRSQTRVPTRSVAIEGLVAVLIVLVASVVVSGQPATEPQLVDHGPAATVGPLAGRFADLQESFDLRPNRPGDATAVVSVFDTRRPSPGPVTAVSVRLGTDHPVPASVVSDGTWAARLPGLAEGPVGIEVRVTRAGAPTVTAHYSWSVARASRPEPRLVSRAPLHTVLRWVALMLAVGFAGAGAELVRRRRVRERPPTQPPGSHSAAPDPDEVLVGRA